MAESLIEIKRKITSTKKTSQITSAMQMVSGSKLNKSEANSRNFQKYSEKVREIVTHLAVTQLELIEGEREVDLFEDENPDDYHSMLIS
ncbi:F0F1 ATP synthase subunit gamma, partial [Vagococcus salmoninarum]